VLWREGLAPDRQEALRQRIDRLGSVRIVFGRGVLALLDHEVHTLVRSWPDVHLVGAVSIDARKVHPTRTPPAHGPRAAG
jgi:hypothetical protein